MFIYQRHVFLLSIFGDVWLLFKKIFSSMVHPMSALQLCSTREYQQLILMMVIFVILLPSQFYVFWSSLDLLFG